MYFHSPTFIFQDKNILLILYAKTSEYTQINCVTIRQLRCHTNPKILSQCGISFCQNYVCITHANNLWFNELLIDFNTCILPTIAYDAYNTEIEIIYELHVVKWEILIKSSCSKFVSKFTLVNWVKIHYT